MIDALHRKRTLLAVPLALLVAGAFLLMGRLGSMTVYSAQFLIGGSGAFLAPTVAGITLGIVGAGAFDKQFGKNQAFNSSGNVFTALLIAYASYKFGYRAIFVIAALLAIPAVASLFGADDNEIDYAARGSIEEQGQTAKGFLFLLKDRFFVSSQPRFFFTWPTLRCCRNWARCYRRATRKPLPHSCPRALS